MYRILVDLNLLSHLSLQILQYVSIHYATLFINRKVQSYIYPVTNSPSTYIFSNIDNHLIFLQETSG